MTEDVRRYRGDWLIEALVAMRRNPHYWQTMTLTPEWVDRHSKGRYHWPTGKWDTQAGDKDNPGQPRYKLVTLPHESDIDYPGETWFLTPSWQTEMVRLIELDGLMHEFRAYEQNVDKVGASIAHYSPSKRAVVWGPHSHAVRRCVLIVSDATPIAEPDAVFT